MIIGVQKLPITQVKPIYKHTIDVVQYANTMNSIKKHGISR